MRTQFSHGQQPIRNKKKRLLAKMDVGDVVKVSGEDFLILKVEAPLGFRQFTVMNLDDGRVKTISKLQIDVVEDGERENIRSWMADPLIDIVEIQPEVAEPVATTKSRFPSITDEKQIDDLAASRLSKTTMAQTKWAVRIMKGNKQ
jgi:hypothetical protein